MSNTLIVRSPVVETLEIRTAGIQGGQGVTGPSGDFFERTGIDFTINKSGGLIATIVYDDAVTLTFNRNMDDTLASIASSDGRIKTLLRDVNGSLTGLEHSVA